jgi:hypothetical protein
MYHLEDNSRRITGKGKVKLTLKHKDTEGGKT